MANFFFIILSAVRTLLFITSQEKILLLGSQEDFQMAEAGILDIAPRNWHLYADATEK
jgi:hypothetical protein